MKKNIFPFGKKYIFLCIQ